MVDAVDSKSTGQPPCQFESDYRQIFLYQGDVLDLTGRLMWISCESERCSPLSTINKKINGNNVIDASQSFGAYRVAA